ncbi:MAG: hypothetical protein RQ847_12385 [Wenzhouxiangellaceae bacterium]|nr:hypothetical protein [Wenzhouxiangellaceae bacterium]
MKKFLLVGVPVLVVVAILAVPAGIGWLVNDRAAAALEKRLPEGAAADWDRGWMRSALRLVAPEYRAELDFRHVPMSPPGWLSVNGRVIMNEPAAAVDVDGHITLGGELRLSLDAPRLDLPGPVAWQYRDPSVRFRTESGKATLAGSAAALLVHDALGNRLAFEQAELTVELVEGAGSAADQAVELLLSLDATRSDRPPSRVRVGIEHIDPGAAEAFVRSVSAWLQAEPGSTPAGVAAVGLASAWQQLAAKGLTLNLHELVLDGASDISGTWVPDERRYRLTGAADRETVLAWWAGITGLARRLAPEQARLEARAALEELAADGTIELAPEQVRLIVESSSSR